MKGISDDQLIALIEEFETQTVNRQLMRDRREALNYYEGKPFGNEVEGRSQVVSREVADTIEWIKPSLMRIFASGDEVVKLDPHGPEDLEQATQESDVLNWYVLQKNDAFAALYTWFTDALLGRNGYMCAYWDVTDDVTEERYFDLSPEEFEQIELDDSVEVVEHSSEVREVLGVVPGEDGMPVQAMMPVEYISCVVRRTKTRGTLRYKPIPPDQAIIDTRLRSVCLSEADFAGYWEQITLSKLRQMYPDEDIPDDLADGTSEHESDHEYRREQITGRSREEHVDPSMRLVKIVYCWLLADRDGDGIAERRYVVKVGSKILYDDTADVVQMACVTPTIFPHRHVGLSIYDAVKDLQEIKSMVQRGLIDSIFLANNGRMAANSERVNLDDLLVSRPGGVIRTTGDPAGALMPVVHPYIGNQITGTLEYLDAVGERRTGVTKYSQGLDANTLNKTATGISLITQAASQRIELIARVFAETGVKDLFLICHALLRKHGTKDTVVKLRGKWLPVDPRSWVKRYDVSVSVGLGTGDKQAQSQSLTLISQLQASMVQYGVGIVSAQNLYDTATKFVQAGGWKDASSFFTDPGENPQSNSKAPFQPPPDPKGQMEQAKLQMEQQKEANASQRAQIDAQVKMQMEQYKIDRESELERYKIDRDAQAVLMKAEIDRDAKLQAAQLTEHSKQLMGSMNAQLEQKTSDATEDVKGAVMSQALEALGPVVQQVGALANAVVQRNGAKRFRVTRNPDGSKDFMELQ